MVATARGIFNSNGGVLSSIETGVSIIIPQGAIPDGVEQEIYFKVCRDNSILPPLDKEKGNSSNKTTTERLNLMNDFIRNYRIYKMTLRLHKSSADCSAVQLFYHFVSLSLLHRESFSQGEQPFSVIALHAPSVFYLLSFKQHTVAAGGP